MSMSLEGVAGLGSASMSWLNYGQNPLASSYGRPATARTNPSSDQVFSVSVLPHGSYTKLLLQGELDMATVADFEYALNDVERGPHPAVVLDLSDLRFLDCSGLHSFVAAHRRFRSAGRRLLFVPGPAPIQRLFELTNVSTLFEFVNPEEAG